MKTREDYFNSPAISRGLLLKYKKSTRTGLALEKVKKDSTAMVAGRAFHSLLEDEFEDFYYIFDDSEKVVEIGGGNPRNTKKYKEWKLEQIEIADGRELISIEDSTMIQTMAKNVRSTELYKRISNTDAKVSNEVAFEAEINGHQYKALADRVVEFPDSITVIDWKSTRADLSLDEWSVKRELIKWDLPLQQVHYTKVIETATKKPVTFVFFFAENHSGFEALPVVISPNSDLITEAKMLWDKCNTNLFATDVKGLDAQLKDELFLTIE